MRTVPQSVLEGRGDNSMRPNENVVWKDASSDEETSEDSEYPFRARMACTFGTKRIVVELCDQFHA
jgi:hypothetical protein